MNSTINNTDSSIGNSIGNITSPGAITLPVGASISCKGSYVVQQYDIDNGYALCVNAYGSSPDLPEGQQTIWTPSLRVEVLQDARFTLDIVAATCTHSRK